MIEEPMRQAFPTIGLIRLNANIRVTIGGFASLGTVRQYAEKNANRFSLIKQAHLFAALTDAKRRCV